MVPFCQDLSVLKMENNVQIEEEEKSVIVKKDETKTLPFWARDEVLYFLVFLLVLLILFLARSVQRRIFWNEMLNNL